MSLHPLSWALLEIFLRVACAAQAHEVAIYLQPIALADTHPANFLAQITFSISEIGDIYPKVADYQAPEIPDEVTHLRIGTYDRAAAQWTSATTVFSVDNFQKGFLPHFRVVVDGSGNPISASCRGVGVDAGQTRDFSPQASVLVVGQGKEPILTTPVPVSAEGRQSEEPEQKTFLQKYWWMLAIGMYVLISGVGSDPEKK